MVTVESSVSAPVSSTWTVRLKVGFVSKSRAAWLFTVIWPLELLMAKALAVLPAVIDHVRLSPSSTSEAAGVPTTVLLARFSLIGPRD